MEIRWLWTLLVFFEIMILIDSTPDIANKKVTKVSNDEKVSEEDKPHSRQKRLVWVTDDGRLALPPGTSLTISPTLALPFVRYPPDGFFSNISISLPLTIDFDKLGLTDNANPLGVVPSLFARSMGRAAGSMLANYVSSYLKSRRKRAIFETNQDSSDSPFKISKETLADEEKVTELPDEHKHAFHGGERALLYATVEDLLATFGMNGHACLLRAICEVHSKQIHHFGLVGEMLKLFFTATKSPFSDLMNEYVKAERIGLGEVGPGECFPYFKDCPRSIFRGQLKNKYSEDLTADSNNQQSDSINSNIVM